MRPRDRTQVVAQAEAEAFRERGEPVHVLAAEKLLISECQVRKPGNRAGWAPVEVVIQLPGKRFRPNAEGTAA